MPVTFVCLLLMPCCGCGGSADSETAERFQEALVAFDTAEKPDDFLRVAGIYEQIVRSGFVSGAVLYNQGNAYMRAGETGRAIASYRQAQRYRPRDPLLAANLRTAWERAGLSGRDKGLFDYLFFWQDWLSYPAKFQWSVVCAAATFLIASTALYRRSATAGRLAVVALSVTLLATLSAGYDWYRFEHLEQGVVVSEQATARKGDAESYEPAFTEPLVEGTEFIVMDRRRSWLRVQLPTGEEGWLREVEAVVY